MEQNFDVNSNILWKKDKSQSKQGKYAQAAWMQDVALRFTSRFYSMHFSHGGVGPGDENITHH